VLAPGAQIHLLFGANGDGAHAVIPAQAGIHSAASL
jgi:hypothetical protein